MNEEARPFAGAAARWALGLLLAAVLSVGPTMTAARAAVMVGPTLSTAASSSPRAHRAAAPANGLASSFKSIHRLLKCPVPLPPPRGGNTPGL